MILKFPKGTKVLLFGTHPDDIEIGAGGAAILMAEQGYELHYAIMTSGEEGSDQIKKNDLIKIREQEARDAAKALHCKSIHFFGYPDGITGFDKPMKIAVIEYLKKINADIIFLHAEDDQNSDHRICTKLILDAIGAAKGPWYPETSAVHINPKLIIGYEVWSQIHSPQTYLDVQNVLAKKLDLIRIFKSQVKDIHYDKAIEGLAYYRSLFSKTNHPCEAYQIYYLHSDLNL